MRFYLITPPDDQGGDEMDMVVAAHSPAEALANYRSFSDGVGAPTLTQVTNQDDWDFDLHWVVREFPPIPAAPGVVGWETMTFTLWTD